MSLQATRTDLSISLVGEDDTAQMLAAAQANMAKLEARLNGVTRATNAQAASAKTASGPMAGFNAAIGGATGAADKALNGFDKITSTLGKVTGAVALAVGAFELLKLGVGFLDDAIGKSKIELMAESLARTRAAAIEAMRAIDDFGKTIVDVGSDITATEIKTNSLLSKQAKARFDTAAAMTFDLKNIKLSAHVEELKIEEELAAINIERIRGSEKERDARDRLGAATRKLAADEAELAKGPPRWMSVSSDAWKKTKADLNAAIKAGQQRVALERDLGNQARKALGWFTKQTAAKRELIAAQKEAALQEAANTLISGIEDVMGKAVAIADATAAARSKAAAAGAAWVKIKDALAEKMWRNEVARDDAEATLHQEKEVRLGKHREEIERLSRKGDTGKVGSPLNLMARQAEAERKAAEDSNNITNEIASNRAIAQSAKEEAWAATQKNMEDEIALEQRLLDAKTDAWAATKRNMDEEVALQDQLRSESASGVLDFSEALRGSLTPELAVFGETMSRITDQVEMFTAGRQSLTASVIGSAGAIASATALAIGGVKEEAAVRAIFELAMGFASIETPPIAAAHFTAALLLGGVAAGVITAPGGGGAPAAKDKKDPEARGTVGNPVGGSSRGGGGGKGDTVINNYNMNTGVSDGQSTVRAFRRAEQNARRTGFAAAGGW